ncbi:DUF4907 domain-containing protein, partial [candidate division KSB1 bacterium]
ILGFFFFSCQNKQKDRKKEALQDTITIIEETYKPPKEIETKQAFDIRTFQNKILGWGYDIYINGKLYIHQPHIPAISGNRGFNSESDAKKTAAYICTKIDKTQSLPSVTIYELDSLGVLKD